MAIQVLDERIYMAVENYEDFQQCIQMGAIEKFKSIEDLALSFRLPVEGTVSTYEAFQRAAMGQATDEKGRTDFGEPP